MFAFIYVSNGYILNSLIYLELWPTYTCDKNVVPLQEDCNHYLMCQREQGKVWDTVISIDWSSTTSLHNWVEKFDLVCVDAWKIGLIGSMYPFGWSLGCLFVPRLGDVLGRRLPFLVSVAISILLYFGVLVSQTIYLNMALFFMIGMTMPGKTSVSYVYLLEMVPHEWKTAVGTMLMFADGSTMIIVSLYFRFVSKQWIYF